MNDTPAFLLLGPQIPDEQLKQLAKIQSIYARTAKEIGPIIANIMDKLPSREEQEQLQLILDRTIKSMQGIKSSVVDECQKTAKHLDNESLNSMFKSSVKALTVIKKVSNEAKQQEADKSDTPVTVKLNKEEQETLETFIGEAVETFPSLASIIKKKLKGSVTLSDCLNWILPSLVSVVIAFFSQSASDSQAAVISQEQYEQREMIQEVIGLKEEQLEVDKEQLEVDKNLQKVLQYILDLLKDSSDIPDSVDIGLLQSDSHSLESEQATKDIGNLDASYGVTNEISDQ